MFEQVALRRGGAIRFTVAIDGDRVVRRVNDGEVDERFPGRLLGLAQERRGPLGIFAARTPPLRAILRERDGVETIAPRIFHRHHSPAPLLEIRRCHPHFERLGRQRERQRRRAQVGLATVEHEAPVSNFRAAFEHAVQFTQDIAGTPFEIPRRDRHDTRCGQVLAGRGGLDGVTSRPIKVGQLLLHRANPPRSREQARGARRLFAQPRRNHLRGDEPRLGQTRFDLRMQAVEFGPVFLQHLGRVDGDLRGPDAGKDPVERGVVALAHGVEFVIVAARAGNREPLKRLAHHVDLAVHRLDLIVERIDGLEAVLDKPEMRGAEDRLVEAVHVQPRSVEQIAGDMLADKLIERHIGVERANQVVAITIRFGNRRIALAAVRLGITHEIHPMPRPVFAEARRGQQQVGLSRQSRSAITGKVGREPLKFPGRGRQTSEDEGEASQERARIDIDGGCEPLRLHFREEKTVHRMRRPRAVRDCGRHVIFHGLERPPPFPRGEQLAPARFPRGFRRGIVARIWRTHGNPAFEIGDDGGGEFRRFVRHFEIGIGVVDRGEERTLRRIAGHDDHTGVPALLPARP